MNNYFQYGTYYWCSETAGLGSNILTMQSEGYLAMYDSSFYEIWSAGYYGYATNAYLIMQNDGNLVIYSDSYGFLWSTGTHQSNF